MSLGKWIKNKVAAVVIATASVEESALKQTGGELGNNTGHVQKHNQGSLADDLINGQITQQVKDLRWRTYKVLEESQNYATKVVGYDEDGTYITERIKITEVDVRQRLDKIRLDDTSDYKLELLVNNDEVTLSIAEALGNNITGETSEPLERSEEDEEDEVKTLGEIKGSDITQDRPMRVINCEREYRTKFNLEDYTKKMNIRRISDTEKMLEFCVSVYPDDFNVKSRLLISDIKKAMKNPRVADFLEIDSVDFVSYNTLGVKDLHEFEYKINKFDSIVEFNGFYVIKFIATAIKNGESLYEAFRQDELDEKYKNKEAKDGNTYNAI